MDAVIAMQKILGYDHPATLDAMQDFALIMNELDKQQQACEVLRRCKDLSSRVFGPNDYPARSRRLLLEKWQDEWFYDRRQLGKDTTMGDEFHFFENEQTVVDGHKSEKIGNSDPAARSCQLSSSATTAAKEPPETAIPTTSPMSNSNQLEQ